MNTIYLDQSTTIITLLFTSLAFATIGIVYSKGKLSIKLLFKCRQINW